MKHELIDLYNAALDCEDQSTIKSYQEAKKRIAPQIVMDLLFENDELVDALSAMRHYLNKSGSWGEYDWNFEKIDNLLRRYNAI